MFLEVFMLKNVWFGDKKEELMPSRVKFLQP